MTRLPDWLIERMLIDEVPAHSRERVRRARQDAETATRAEALRVDNARLLKQLSPADVAAEVQRRVHERHARAGDRLGRLRSWRWAVPLVACAVVVLAFVISSNNRETGPGEPAVRGDEPGHRSKGTLRLIAHRQVGATTETLLSGARARAGDRIQLWYQIPGDAIHTSVYGAVVSIDGRGTLTWHVPSVTAASDADAAQLSTGTRVPLPHSYELDDAPRFERFVLVVSNAPFSLHVVADAVRALLDDPSSDDSRPLPLPSHMSQTSFLLAKGTSP